MKINYTLPGMVPETDVGKEVVEAFDSPFKNRMQAFERKQPVAWRELLGLNHQPPDPQQLAAPAGQSAVTDATVVRRQWRDLLSRHTAGDELQNAPPAVQRMLTLLNGYQKESDRLFSLGLAETEQ